MSLTIVAGAAVRFCARWKPLQWLHQAVLTSATGACVALGWRTWDRRVYADELLLAVVTGVVAFLFFDWRDRIAVARPVNPKT